MQMKKFPLQRVPAAGSGGLRVGAAAVIALVLLASGIASAQDAPDQLVKSVGQDVLQIVRQDRELRTGSRAKMEQLIQDKIAPHFDFERMTRLAVGRSWREASPEQRKRLVEAFRQLLVRSYANAYNSTYKDISIDVKPFRLDAGADDVQVKSLVKLSSDAQPVTVDYSMYKSGVEWKVYDVSVAGVSLVTTYRGTFAQELRNGGIDGLIKSLEDKNMQAARS
jgi:phospholipid transport system substrate-binding protein